MKKYILLIFTMVTAIYSGFGSMDPESITYNIN
jgi:hypothetical protein